MAPPSPCSPLRQASCSILLITTLSACFTADLDPTASGLFACIRDEDCPGTMRCSNAVCYAEERVPTVALTRPLPLEILEASEWSGKQRPLIVEIRGTLELRAPGEADGHTIGEGHLVIEVDGQEVATVTQGSLTEGLPRSILLDNTPGPHRIRVQCMRNDQTPYDHDGAAATRLIWIDDGRPYVAFATPWPEASLPLEMGSLEIQLATLNYVLHDPDQGRGDAQGPASLHYDAEFPSCFDRPACIDDPLAMVGASTVATVTLPPVDPGAEPGPVTLSAVLRDQDGAVFRTGDPPTPVLETITLDRSASIR